MPKFIISVMYDGFPGKYLVVTDFSYEADNIKSARDIFTSIVFSFNRNGYFLWESDPVRCYVKGNHDDPFGIEILTEKEYKEYINGGWVTNVKELESKLKGETHIAKVLNYYKEITKLGRSKKKVKKGGTNGK